MSIKVQMSQSQKRHSTWCPVVTFPLTPHHQPLLGFPQPIRLSSEGE